MKKLLFIFYVFCLSFLPINTYASGLSGEVTEVRHRNNSSTITIQIQNDTSVRYSYGWVNTCFLQIITDSNSYEFGIGRPGLWINRGENTLTVDEQKINGNITSMKIIGICELNDNGLPVSVGFGSKKETDITLSLENMKVVDATSLVVNTNSAINNANNTVIQSNNTVIQSNNTSNSTSASSTNITQTTDATDNSTESGVSWKDIATIGLTAGVTLTLTLSLTLTVNAKLNNKNNDNSKDDNKTININQTTHVNVSGATSLENNCIENENEIEKDNGETKDSNVE